jgi:hypothetical protein
MMIKWSERRALGKRSIVLDNSRLVGFGAAYTAYTK